MYSLSAVPLYDNSSSETRSNKLLVFFIGFFAFMFKKILGKLIIVPRKTKGMIKIEFILSFVSPEDVGFISKKGCDQKQKFYSFYVQNF